MVSMEIKFFRGVFIVWGLFLRNERGGVLEMEVCFFFLRFGKGGEMVIKMLWSWN